MLRAPLKNNEFYHIYNRGVDKRFIFSDKKDVERFMKGMVFFNDSKPVGSLQQVALRRYHRIQREKQPLVKIVCYCLNPNHFHMILQQVRDGGISEFMKRLLGGYTWYFNYRNKRTGSLFQGRFKYVHIDTNEQLLHTSVYVNCNDKAHELSGPTARLVQSSLDEYTSKYGGFHVCDKYHILNQFESMEEYKIFAENTLEEIIYRKQLDR